MIEDGVGDGDGDGDGLWQQRISLIYLRECSAYMYMETESRKQISPPSNLRPRSISQCSFFIGLEPKLLSLILTQSYNNSYLVGLSHIRSFFSKEKRSISFRQLANRIVIFGSVGSK